VKPVGAGTPFVPDAVTDESAGAVKVIEGVAVNTLVVPSAFFAVMTVLGDSVALTVARYPGVPGGVATVVVFTPVVALPSGLTVAANEVVAEGFVTTGASSPPPHPPAIIKVPNKADKLSIFNNLLILNTSLFLYEILARKIPYPVRVMIHYQTLLYTRISHNRELTSRTKSTVIFPLKNKEEVDSP
jgi:hypothetical protein